MNRQFNYLFQLGLAITVMCTSGTLGRYVHLPPPVAIWARCVLGALALLVFLRLSGAGSFIGWGRHFRIVVISAVFLGIHWITYFYSLQLSSVAIGMLSLFTYPVMTTLLEPLILKTRFQPAHFGLAIVAFTGVAFLVPEVSLENEHTLGVLLGLVSAFFYSIRNILLKKNISEHSGVALMYYQLLILSLVLSPVLFFFNVNAGIFLKDWDALLVLGLFTTATGHSLFVMSFRHFSISTVSIMSSLTPLLGTFVGYLVLDEIPAGHVMIGGLLIFMTVAGESLRTIRS